MEEAAGTSMDVVRIMEICRDVEVYVSEIYYHFAECFRDVPDMARLWKKTAVEEENHASQFVMAINLRRQDLVHSVGIDMATAEKVLERVKALLVEVKQSRPSASEAFGMAIRLEEELATYHMSSLAMFREKSHKALFEAMMKNDRDHVLELTRAYEGVLAGQRA